MQTRFENLAGQPIPEACFHVQGEKGWTEVDSRAFFAGRRVIVFALPGAFTPTCSSAHLPGYEALASTFAANGIDAVYCLSVNDSFVMQAWGEAQKVRNVGLIADGNAALTRALGMDVEKTELGFGVRSWRYSMVVDDGVIEQMFIEPDLPGDPFQVSDADTMLAFVAPEAHAPRAISMLTRPGCVHCARAKAMLDARGIAYEEIQLGRDATATSLRAIAGATSVPQVFVDGLLIGGADQLAEKLEGGL